MQNGVSRKPFRPTVAFREGAYTAPVNFADLFTLARRGLSRRPVRTLLTVLGIVVAVASMVVFLSLGEGFRRALGQEIGNIGPDIQVTLEGSDPTQFGGTIPEVPLENVAKLEGLREELGIAQVFPLTLTARGGFGDSYVLEGYPVERVGLADIYPSLKLAAGRLLTTADAGGAVAVVGAKAAERGNLAVGREVRFNRQNRFRVVGVLAEGGGFTDSFIFVPLDRLSSAIGVAGKASVIAVKLSEPGGARAAADAIEARYPELQAQTQGDVLQVLDRAIAIGDAFRFGISLISLIVGALAVANTVMMGVYERTREFGVIRAMGAKPSFVFRLVVLESVLLAIVGGLGGLVLGYLGTLAVNYFVRDLVSVNIAALTPRLALLALGVAGALGLLSGLLPARTASRLVITQALGRN